jgi:hypothetical protein
MAGKFNEFCVGSSFSQRFKHGSEQQVGVPLLAGTSADGDNFHCFLQFSLSLPYVILAAWCTLLGIKEGCLKLTTE